MATINIGRNNFYIYKMPVLSIKIIGKGNGIKTELTNIEDIYLNHWQEMRS